MTNLYILILCLSHFSLLYASFLYYKKKINILHRHYSIIIDMWKQALDILEKNRDLIEKIRKEKIFIGLENLN